MALWIHSLLCLIPAPIDRHAVFASANKQHDKGWAWWWKAVELYICFLMGYFQNFSFLPPPNKVIPILSFFCMFLRNISPAISSTPTLFMFLHPTARQSQRMVLGCLPPPAVFRETFRWCACIRGVCVYNSGSVWRACYVRVSDCWGDWSGWTNNCIKI